MDTPNLNHDNAEVLSEAAKKTMERISELTGKGYAPMPLSEGFGNADDSDINQLIKDHNLLNMNLLADTTLGGGMFVGSENPIVVPNKGTPNLGYIEWGSGNRLPNVVALYVSLLPYTATAIKFNVDTVSSTGPTLKYKWVRYVNGTLKTELIDYADAGELIRGKLMELRKLLVEYPDVPGSIDSDTSNIRKQILEDIETTKKDYERWQGTNDKVKSFLENNDLNLTYLKLFEDDGYMDISFPEFELSQGRPSEEWVPGIVGIRHRSVMTCRMEQMDRNGIINNIYVSNQWRTQCDNTLYEDQRIDAISALNPETALKDLRRIISKKKNSPLRGRPTRFILPTYYPSINHPYYPHPAWWSIFPSKIYQYAATLMRDKATARENSNMWGKIVYVHTGYLDQLYMQRNASDEEEKTKVRNELWQQILKFLKNRDNNGKAMLGFTFSFGEKQLKSIEIVDVPQSQSGAITKTELEEIASIIFFAMEVHPSLIGAVPGKSGSSGGTSQREMDLLKQKRMKPRRKRYLRLLEIIHAFNGWDEKGVWVIPDQTLTTLDRSGTGLTETEDTN